MRLTAFCLMLLATIGCSSSISTVSTAPTAKLAGTYEGTSSDSIAGSGVFVMTLQQDGSRVTGRWGDSYAKTHVVTVGELAGSLTGNVLRANATSEVRGACPLTLVATLDGSSLSGSYQGVGPRCSTETGTFTIPSVVPSVVFDKRPFTGTVTDDLFGQGAARIDLGQPVLPFVRGTFSFDYKHRQKGHVTGFIHDNGEAHFAFLVETPPGQLAQCEMTVVGGKYVQHSSLDAAYVSLELFPCLYKDRSGKFFVHR